MATSLGTLNPFRYRSYVYDEETSLYYLRSRYYDPDWGRFINADSVLEEKILFSYCGNSPINNIDDDGFRTRKAVFPMLASYLVQQVKRMHREGWQYVHGNYKEGEVDCIGVILYSALQYFGSWNRYDFVIDGKKITFGLGTNKAIAHKNVDKDTLISNLIPIDSSLIEATLLPGMILYRSDFGHVGVYVGNYIAPDGTHYTHAVIHAANADDDMVVQNVWDADFSYYCCFDYIELDMTYNQTVPGKKRRKRPNLLQNTFNAVE